MSRARLQLAAYTPRNRLSSTLGGAVLAWCILSPLLIALLSVFDALGDAIRWHWWLPAAAYAVAVALNLPTPHVPRELVRKLDQPDAFRMGRGALFGWGVLAATVVQGQAIALDHDDPWLAVFGPGPLPPLEPAAWVLLGTAAVVALRSLAGALGWVPAAWREVTEDDIRTGNGRSRS